MTQICFPSNNKYLDYKCHFKLNNYFSGIKILKDEENNVINYLKRKIIQKTYSQNEKDIFNKLYHYLKGDGVFPWQDPTECCKYINYWLNTTVQNLVPGLYNTESFKIFQNIVDFYNEDKNKNNKRCISDIKYIESDELIKMGNLYTMYKNHEELVAESKGYYYDPCKILIKMHLNYNDALTSSANNDNNLFSRLENFKKYIDVIPQKEKKDCPPYIYFKDPGSIKKTKNTESEHHSRIHDTTNITPELQRPEKETTHPEQKATLPEQEATHPEPDSRTPETYSPSPPVLQSMTSELQASRSRRAFSSSGRNALEETNSELSQTTYDGKLRGKTLKPGSFHSGGTMYTDTLENSIYSENDVLGKLERKTSDDGFLGKVQGAFSTMVEGVDPGPVLGVSGGMGALFLLFKYTPVGSFFGGRKGRFRQIPRSFNGPFQGEFPNFQDYDGGYIGYGPMNPLAE
ncbi:hypothetical protein, conserved [Plasmodium vivax]|uniref:VIR protein n=1 Tax=Plasmodium vivax TaxID=5855 RepID=A0A1G4E7R3_PLAVI|nr:hypothetical protein, conserved [Plasmodium vivax]